MRKFLCGFILFFAFACSAHCFTVTHISVSGLKRTKESYIQSVLSEFTGLDSEKIDFHRIETVLEEQGLFCEYSVSLNEEAECIEIAVKEKWSFLAAPFAAYTNDGIMAGGIVMDQNAFGRRCNLMVGGTYASSYSTAMIQLSKSAVDLHHPGFSIFATYQRKEIEICDLDDTALWEYDAHKLDFEFSLNEKFSSNFTAGFGGKYISFLSVDDDFTSVHQFTFNPTVKYSACDWNGYFLSESYVEAKLAIGGNTDGDFVLSDTVHAFLQKPIVPRLRYSVDIGFYFEYVENRLYQKNRQSFTNNIIPSNFVSENFQTLDVTLEGAVLKTKMMTVSLFETFQAVCTKAYSGEWDFCYGPGGGLKVYLSKINLPACGVGLYYNVPKNSVQFGASDIQKTVFRLLKMRRRAFCSAALFAI